MQYQYIFALIHYIQGSYADILLKCFIHVIKDFMSKKIKSSQNSSNDLTEEENFFLNFLHFNKTFYMQWTIISSHCYLMNVNHT